MKLLLRVVEARDTSLSQGPNILRHVSVLTSQQCCFFLKANGTRDFCFTVFKIHKTAMNSIRMRLQTYARKLCNS